MGLDTVEWVCLSNRPRFRAVLFSPDSKRFWI